MQVSGAGRDSRSLLLLSSEHSKNSLSELVAKARHGIPVSSGPNRHAGVGARATGGREADGTKSVGIQDTSKRCKEKNLWKLEFESPKKILERTCHSAPSSLRQVPWAPVVGPFQIAVFFRVGSRFPQLWVRRFGAGLHPVLQPWAILGPFTIYCFLGAFMFLRPWVNIQRLPD